MLPGMPITGKGGSKLLALYQKLPAAGQQTLLAFAEFLQTKCSAQQPADPRRVELPLQITRPPQESVVAAIRRLSRNYAMLDKKTLLHETADLMSAHVLKGRAAAEVIDDLEALFAERYAVYRRELEQDQQA